MSQHHDSARTHVTGESVFIGDRPPLHNELYVGFIGSPIAHGKITELDVSAARNVSGVAAVLTAADIPGHNAFGGMIQDQPFLAGDVVSFAGEPIAVVGAETHASLHQALAAIRVKIDPLAAMVDIPSAIAADSYQGEPRLFLLGDPDAAFANATHIVEGTFETGGQEHYYFETHSTVVYPGEEGSIEIHSSTQHPTETQHAVAELLGIPFSQVVCVAKRLGGAFGGKESQANHFAGLAALVAHTTQRPARIVLERDEDMRSSGKRHPFRIEYKIACDDDGRLLAMESHLFADGGAWLDLSGPILDRALFHSTNAYFVPNVRLVGRICRTNLPPNTAFRGFGAPQGAIAMEHMIEEVAKICGKDPAAIRKLNLWGVTERNQTSYGQLVTDHSLPDLVNRLEETSNFASRRKDIAEFNTRSKTHIRGIALVPFNFGISFTATFLNQANALVNVHLDGTVQVSTGAIEMGQGVNTKIAQTVADVLGIPIAAVRVMATSTEKNHNTSATAASSGADLNCAAAQEAAMLVRDRLAACALAHFAGEQGEIDLTKDRPLGDITFIDGQVTNTTGDVIALRDLLKMAYIKRISLGGYAFYRTPGIHFDKVTAKGNPFKYYTQGAAVSEVEIDRFSGALRLRRVDVLIDLGKSFCTDIDRGQIAGALMQGVGWVTNEELKYSETGQLLSNTTSTYKIPAITDFPEEFHCDLWDRHHATAGVKGSKAVGEPPFLLAMSAWVAIKSALESVPGVDTKGLPVPATGERILMALENSLTAWPKSCYPDQ